MWVSKIQLLCYDESMHDSTNAKENLVLPWPTFPLLSKKQEKGGYMQ